MTDVPVLLVVFNRPETTARVMAALRQARPRRLYVAADGPRPGRGEESRCKEARRVATTCDWPCEVRTLFRDANVGCGIAVSSAISWFFEHETEGIILEDDCVPSRSFFPYCGELLERYRDDTRIMCISGNNVLPAPLSTPYSYYFSRQPLTWGWATWRRAWRLFDYEMAQLPEFMQSQALQGLSNNEPSFVQHWTRVFSTMAPGQRDVWDYQWTLSCWANGGLTCIPRQNLVRNIGFGLGATHTTFAQGRGHDLTLGQLAFPLQHPSLVLRDLAADRTTYAVHFHDAADSAPRWSQSSAWQLVQRARGRLKIRTRMRNAIARLAH